MTTYEAPTQVDHQLKDDQKSLLSLYNNFNDDEQSSIVCPKDLFLP